MTAVLFVGEDGDNINCFERNDKNKAAHEAAASRRTRGVGDAVSLKAPPTFEPQRSCGGHRANAGAAVDAFAGLMRSRANRRRAAANGDVSGLLRLYEDWHRRDGDRARVTICRALLHCLNRVTDTAAASAALLADGGLGLLFRTTQVCLAREGLSPLLDPAVQLMRKCYPKSAVPLASESSACTFPLPARCPAERSAAPAPPDEESEDDSEEDDETEHNGGQVSDPRLTSRLRHACDSEASAPLETVLKRPKGAVLDCCCARVPLFFLAHVIWLLELHAAARRHGGFTRFLLPLTSRDDGCPDCCL
ncbi:cytosolic carboxypeptidase 4-like [Arapaima gigas]